MSNKVKLAGIPFPGRPEWVIPPLSLGSLELLQDRIGKLSLGGTDPESIRTIVDATHMALVRNYPDVPRDQVAAEIDLGNMMDVIAAVMDVAGVRRKELEAGEVEKKAAATSP
ncbi:hypothetical protein GCM10007933_02370 [Zoogloea oryzae]|uniref:Tail assembly chaperone n=1 Tax=Zoogloea oryzae TaxID=310767 RepID=A0ABQ6F5H2_9RHOO|nr:hypothetical protein [Zoogloea oryzae]GLT20785.1 hypothetical protein GCM10007933_02370 [Zoogloea oryzae]